MYVIGGLLAVISCWIICLYLPLEKQSCVKHFVEANSIFCLQYLIFSCVFLSVEKFAVWKPLVVLIICNVMIITVLYFTKRKRKSFFCLMKVCKEEVLICIITICMIIPFIYITSEDIAAITDQGAYFFHTILLMEEKNELVHEIQEIGSISAEVDKGLKELQEEFTIYYHDKTSDYYIFALNTWCIFPALFGKIFGLWKCMKAANYLLLLAIMNVFYICKRLAKNKNNIYIFIGMFALSPLVLYIGKAGLSEVAVLLFFVMGLRYLLEERKIFSVIGGLCVGCVGFIHLSMYVYIPIITVMAMLESVKKKHLVYFNIVQLALFGLSIWYAYAISPIYVKKQYLRFTFNERISYPLLFLIIDIVVLLCISMQFYIDRSKTKLFVAIRLWMFKYFKIIVLIVWGIVIVCTIYNAYCIGYTQKFAIPEGYDAGSWNLRVRYVGTGAQAISYLNIINIARATGGVGLIIVFLIPFLQKNLSDRAKIFYYLMIYAIVVFTVLQVDTPFNYYASRYFVPFLVPLMIIVIVSSISSRNWALYVLIVTILFNKNYWYSFPTGGPQVGQYRLLQDSMEVIPEGSIVLADVESGFVNTRLTSNLRILNNNQIYNLANYKEVREYYSDNDIYVISGKELNDVGDLIWNNTYICQYSFGNGKNGSYARKIGTYEEALYIYK